MAKDTAGAKRVTLQDIAQHTGYTVNTVSRALKNKSDISRATCERIQAVAAELGYVRNVMASALRSGRTKTLGVIVGGMANPFYSIMTDELQDEAMARGYSLVILCSRDQPELEMQAVETAISRQVDGILLFPCTASQRSIERMKAAGVPFVLMSRYLERGREDCVVCDEEQGAYLAAQHLLRAGHRKLAYLYTYDVVFSGEQRQRGFLRALDEAGIPACDRFIYKQQNEQDTARQLLAWKSEGVTGLFVFCDMEAWLIISCIQKMGLRIPEDFALVGFDNIQSKLHFPTLLCSVDGCMPGVARAGIDLLRSRIHGDAQPPQTLLFPVKLVCRGACESKEKHIPATR
ncbi:MAG: LacI family DNA-binding transcriptional regulator [Clostridia bacterium]